MPPGQALIGEVQVAIGGEYQVVDRLEAFEVDPLEHRLDRAGLRIEQHDAPGIVRDEDAAVLMDLQAVGLAIVFGDQLEPALRVDPEHAAPGHVHAI